MWERKKKGKNQAWKKERNKESLTVRQKEGKIDGRKKPSGNIELERIKKERNPAKKGGKNKINDAQK